MEGGWEEMSKGKAETPCFTPTLSVHRTFIQAVLALVQLSGFWGADREMEEEESHRGDETALKFSEEDRVSQKKGISSGRGQ